MMGLASCDDKSDLGMMQQNPQENVLTIGAFTISPQAPFNGTQVDLNDCPAQVPVLTYSVAEALPEGTEVKFVLEISDTPDFAGSKKLDLTKSESGVYTVNADALSADINSYFGLAPIPRDISMRIAGYIQNGSQLSMIREDKDNCWFMAGLKKMVSIDPHLDIEASYYFVNTLQGMDLASAPAMTHSTKHQYDDPTFSYVINVTAADVNAAQGKVVEFMIAPESAVKSGDKDKCFGAATGADPTALEGALQQGGAKLMLTEPANYLVRVNMETLTYSVMFASDYLYVWTPRFQWNAGMRIATDNYINYSGLGYIFGPWKLTADKSFNSLQIGKGDEPGTLKFGQSVLPMLTPEEGNNLYYITADLSEMSYNTTLIEHLGIVGSLTDWGGTPDFAMTPADDLNNVYTAVIDITEGDEWKIRANSSWDFNWGCKGESAPQGETAMNGANFKSDYTGKLKITFDLTTLPYTVKVTPVN